MGVAGVKSCGLGIGQTFANVLVQLAFGEKMGGRPVIIIDKNRTMIHQDHRIDKIKQAVFKFCPAQFANGPVQFEQPVFRTCNGYVIGCHDFTLLYSAFTMKIF